MIRRTDRPLISLNAVKLNEKGDPIEAVTTASLNTVLSEGNESFLRHLLAAARGQAYVAVVEDFLKFGGGVMAAFGPQERGAETAPTYGTGALAASGLVNSAQRA